jgi:hypothetical protein
MVAAMAGGLPGGMVPGAGSGPTSVAALQSSAGNQATGRLLAGAAPAPAPSTPSLTGSFGQVGDLVNDPALPDATAQVSAADPSSHIDWEKWWADPSNKLSVLRMPLEVLRAWPGPGLLFGAAADGVNIYQDFSQISGEEAPFLKAFMGLRSTLLVINNIIGHLVYIDQFVQDGLAVSVVGIEFTPLSAGLNGLLKLTKSYLDLCLLFIDFGLLCGAGYRASKAPPGSESAKNFAAMFGNYAANSMTDLVTFVIDVIDMVSGGVSNGEVIKSGVGAVNAILKGAIKLSPIIRSILIGWFGIFGGIPLTPKTSALTPEASTASALAVDAGTLAPAARAGAIRIILAELRSMKASYLVGDELLSIAGQTLSTMLTQVREAATKANDGKDPFIAARDAASNAVGRLGEVIGEYANIQATSTTAGEYAAQVEQMADSLIAMVDALQVPDVHIPKADLGDNAVADVAELVTDAAGGLAEGALQTLVDQVKALVDEVKPTIRGPIEEGRATAREAAEFAEFVAAQAGQQIVWASQKSAEISAKLATCATFEDFINLVVAQVMSMLGIEGELTVDDIGTGWTQLGVELDGAIVWAEGLNAPSQTDSDTPGPSPTVAADQEPPANSPREPSSTLTP